LRPPGLSHKMAATGADMLKDSFFETCLSALIALFAVGFLLFMRWQTGIGSLSSYQVGAMLRQADSLAIGTDVKIAGVKVGRITELAFEPKSYRVRMTMDIRSDVHIPADSRLSVSGGMMSSPYLTIAPGHSNKMIDSGGTLSGG
jgi:phospholipid/cholesterol/gamma-HCH transport system substrate-binding protein